jgi:hypothetical protein
MSNFREYFYKLNEAYDVSKSDKGKFRKKSLISFKKKKHFDLRKNDKYKIGKRPNKTQQARDFLFKKQGIRKAKARANGKYILDHNQIKDLMSGMGFEFNPKAGKWAIGKGVLPSKEKKQEKPVTPSIQNIQQKIINQKKQILDTLPDPRDPEAPLPPEPEDLIEVPDEFDTLEEFEDEEFESIFPIGKNGEIYHITEREVMIFQARFLLGLIWEEFSYSQYRLEPDGKQWAIQSRGDTLRAMDALSMRWDAIDDTWHTEDGRQVLRLRINHNENKKSVVGRGLLANMNFLEFLEFDPKTKSPKMGIDDVKEQLEKQEFRWNDEDEVWYYVGDDHRADFGNISHGEEDK